jgi:hypothetical protein
MKVKFIPMFKSNVLLNNLGSDETTDLANLMVFRIICFQGLRQKY